MRISVGLNILIIFAYAGLRANFVNAQTTPTNSPPQIIYKVIPQNKVFRSADDYFKYKWPAQLTVQREKKLDIAQLVPSLTPKESLDLEASVMAVNSLLKKGEKIDIPMPLTWNAFVTLTNGFKTNPDPAIRNRYLEAENNFLRLRTNMIQYDLVKCQINEIEENGTAKPTVIRTNQTTQPSTQ